MTEISIRNTYKFNTNNKFNSMILSLHTYTKNKSLMCNKHYG